MPPIGYNRKAIQTPELILKKGRRQEAVTALAHMATLMRLREQPRIKKFSPRPLRRTNKAIYASPGEQSSIRMSAWLEEDEEFDNTVVLWTAQTAFDVYDKQRDLTEPTRELRIYKGSLLNWMLADRDYPLEQRLQEIGETLSLIAMSNGDPVRVVLDPEVILRVVDANATTQDTI